MIAPRVSVGSDAPQDGAIIWTATAITLSP